MCYRCICKYFRIEICLNQEVHGLVYDNVLSTHCTTEELLGLRSMSISQRTGRWYDSCVFCQSGLTKYHTQNYMKILSKIKQITHNDVIYVLQSQVAYIMFVINQTVSYSYNGLTLITWIIKRLITYQLVYLSNLTSSNCLFVCILKCFISYLLLNRVPYLLV